MVRVLGALGIAALLCVSPAAAGPDARQAVTTFLERLGSVRVTDLTVQQTITIYHPEGRLPTSAGDQILYIKLPQRQRLEQMVEGQREVRLTVAERTWVRRADGRVEEARTGDQKRDRLRLFTPLPRSAEDIIAEWRSFGVRPHVSHLVNVRGRPVTIIGAGPDDRTSPAVWFDAEYGVVRIVTRERLPQGTALVDLTLSDHRPLVDSFYFPYRQELFANGRLVLRAVVRTASVNGNLPAALFDPEALRNGG